MTSSSIHPPLWGQVFAARIEALAARVAYDEAAAGYHTAVAENDTCYPVTQFEAARALGEAGARMETAIGVLDDLHDYDGFHAAYTGAATLRALIGR